MLYLTSQKKIDVSKKIHRVSRSHILKLSFKILGFSFKIIRLSFQILRLGFKIIRLNFKIHFFSQDPRSIDANMMPMLLLCR